MKIETTFNPGDKAWVMKNDKPHQFKIATMEIVVHEGGDPRTIYIDMERGLTMMDKDREYRYSSGKCFATKRDLLNSFLSEGEI